MKDIFLGLIPFSSYIAVISQEDLTFWERIAEKWGIGFIGLGLFFFLAKWTAKRETTLQEQRDKKEAESLAERVALLTENNRLQGELLKAINSHATRAEQMTRDSMRATNDHAAALRQLVRKMKRPCVEAFEEAELERHKSKE